MSTGCENNRLFRKQPIGSRASIDVCRPIDVNLPPSKVSLRRPNGIHKTKSIKRRFKPIWCYLQTPSMVCIGTSMLVNSATRCCSETSMPFCAPIDGVYNRIALYRGTACGTYQRSSVCISIRMSVHVSKDRHRCEFPIRMDIVGHHE